MESGCKSLPQQIRGIKRALGRSHDRSLAHPRLGQPQNPTRSHSNLFSSLCRATDPLTALSVAGTIVQFADFGSRLFSEGKELYKPTQGVLAANDELELVTSDLRALIVNIEPWSSSIDRARPLAKEEAEKQERFQRICAEAVMLADDLIQRLDQLKIRVGKGRKRESFRKAIQSAWSRDEIVSMNRRLASLKDAMETQILFYIR